MSWSSSPLFPLLCNAMVFFTIIPTAMQCHGLLHHYSHCYAMPWSSSPLFPLLCNAMVFFTIIPTAMQCHGLLHHYPHCYAMSWSSSPLSPLLCNVMVFFTIIPTAMQCHGLLHHYPHCYAMPWSSSPLFPLLCNAMAFFTISPTAMQCHGLLHHYSHCYAMPWSSSPLSPLLCNVMVFFTIIPTAMQCHGLLHHYSHCYAMSWSSSPLFPLLCKTSSSRLLHPVQLLGRSVVCISLLSLNHYYYLQISEASCHTSSPGTYPSFRLYLTNLATSRHCIPHHSPHHVTTNIAHISTSNDGYSDTTSRLPTTHLPSASLSLFTFSNSLNNCVSLSTLGIIGANSLHSKYDGCRVANARMTYRSSSSPFPPACL